MKILNKRILITLSLIVALLVMGLQLAFAAGGVNMPALSKDSSTLTVTAQYTDETESTPISGMSLQAIKVADVAVSGGIANYTSTSDFESAGIDFNEMTATDSIEAASKLAEIATDKELKGPEATSDGDGNAKFGSLPNGMYLVMQTGAKGDAEGYTEIAPYLVMLPQPLTDIGVNDWEYDVKSIPKMAVEPKAIKITKKVNSQDNASVEKRSNKFTYEIVTELTYAPEDFAVVDNVPDPLEIVDRDLIEVTVNGTKLSNEVRDQIISIKGNTLRIEPTEEQLKEWMPFEMNILFKCRFRQNIKLLASNLSVVNVAGYEVAGVYYEPPGDDNEAAVQGVFEADEDDEEEAEKPEVKGENKVRGSRTDTGDYTNIGIFAAVVVAAALIIFFMIKRRRKTE